MLLLRLPRLSGGGWPPNGRLSVGRIEGSAFLTADRQIMNLRVLSMHKNDSALPAGIVNRMHAGDEDRGRAQHMTRGCRYELQRNARVIAVELMHAASRLRVGVQRWYPTECRLMSPGY